MFKTQAGQRSVLRYQAWGSCMEPWPQEDF